jgi:hypothetical protein
MLSEAAGPETSGLVPDWLADVLATHTSMAPGGDSARGLRIDLVAIPNTPAAAFPRLLSRRRRREVLSPPLADFSASCWVASLSLPDATA